MFYFSRRNMTPFWTNLILCPLFCRGLMTDPFQTRAHFLHPVCPTFYLETPHSVHVTCSPRAPSPCRFVNKLSLCHGKHSAEHAGIQTRTLRCCGTSAALFCEPVAASLHTVAALSASTHLPVTAHTSDCSRNIASLWAGWGRMGPTHPPTKHTCLCESVQHMGTCVCVDPIPVSLFPFSFNTMAPHSALAWKAFYVCLCQCFPNKQLPL